MDIIEKIKALPDSLDVIAWGEGKADFTTTDLKALANRAEAAEAKLATAEKALEHYAEREIFCLECGLLKGNAAVHGYSSFLGECHKFVGGLATKALAEMRSADQALSRS